MEKKLLLFILLSTASCKGMFLLELFLGKPQENVHPRTEPEPARIVDFLTLINHKRFEAALQLSMNLDELEKNPKCLAMAINNGASSEFVEALIQKYPCMREGFYDKAIPMACRKKDERTYKILIHHARKTAGILFEDFLKAILKSRIHAAAGGNFSLLITILEADHKMRDSEKARYSTLEADSSVDSNDNYTLKMCSLNTRATKAVLTIPPDPEKWRNRVVEKCKHSLPLNAAVDWDQGNNALLLLLNGADPRHLDHTEESALMIAQRRKLEGMSRLIEFFSLWKGILRTLRTCPQLKKSRDNRWFIRGMPDL